MVRIITKKVKGKEYLYLVHSVRHGKKVVPKMIKYIGKKRPIPQEEFGCMEYSFSKKDWILTETRDMLSYTEHIKLRKASTLYKDFVRTLDVVSKEKEKEKFLSIFIANSNAIEGSTLTVKETSNYLFHDIVPPHHMKKELFMASNLLDAWRYVEQNTSRFPTHEDICTLHRLVNKGIEANETLGTYKNVQNYIGDIHTSSYLFVEERMDELLKWIRKAYRRIDNFEVAFQSHIQFEIIHPFVDGNGRIGRLLMNWLLMYKEIMPLAIHIRHRSKYISALENSKMGGLKPICQFCAEEYHEQYTFV